MKKRLMKNKLFIGVLVLTLLYLLGFSQINSAFAYVLGASPSEATTSDATGSDATESQATNSNEEIGDVNVPSDNVLLIEQLNFDSEGAVTAGEFSKLNFDYSGAEVIGAQVELLYKNGTDFEYASVVKQGNDYYFFLPDNAVPGKYTVKSLIFTSRNSDGSTFDTVYADDTLEELNCFKTVQIDNPNGFFSVDLKSISLSKTDVNPLDKVRVNYDLDEDIDEMTLHFVKGNENIPIYVRSLDDNPYFIVPSDMEEGNYKLEFINVSGNGIYATAAVNENIYLKVSKKSGDTNEGKVDKLVFNNDNIDRDALDAIYNSSKDATIILNADNKKIISADIFNVIKGTNRKLVINNGENQIIFYGKDIKLVKTIDVSIKVDNVKNDKQINSINKGVVLTFANNGTLPGKATVRIKNNDFIKKILKNNPVNLYYFVPNKNNFNLITKGIKVSGDYYEFSITHNSKYVLTDYEIASQLVSVDNTMAFQKNYKSYALILMIVGSLLVGSVVLSKKMKKNKKEEVIEVL